MGKTWKNVLAPWVLAQGGFALSQEGLGFYRKVAGPRGVHGRVVGHRK